MEGYSVEEEIPTYVLGLSRLKVPIVPVAVRGMLCEGPRVITQHRPVPL